MTNFKFSQQIDDLVTQNALRILSDFPSLALAYLIQRHNEEKNLQLWQGLLVEISEHPDGALSTLTPLLEAARLKSLPENLKPLADEMDVFVNGMLSRMLSNEAETTQTSLLRQILQTPGKMDMPLHACLGNT